MRDKHVWDMNRLIPLPNPKIVASLPQTQGISLSKITTLPHQCLKMKFYSSRQFKTLDKDFFACSHTS